ncbi:hypothetical protein ASPFODRAFT_462198 [Aspergillus luchuensis CBS 106.47]|uniref:Uncharacterized protein n=1 Tax=Aspergillus luchuensis (strain CBS 106.47) TaxID=1137211 RepID=A0A1M3T0B8_ASPLC|nr:hypothetical protein ASPFODRAFT_462198 [Aspergillus luchuensis CBS 106.47]
MLGSRLREKPRGHLPGNQEITLMGVLPERDSTKPSTRRGLKFRGSKEDCGHKIMQGRGGFCRRHSKNSTT